MLRELAAGRPATAVAGASRTRDRDASPGRELRLAQAAALAAVDAPPVSWLGYVADDTDAIDQDEVAAVLVAIAPIIGAPRVAAAAERAIAAARLFERADTD